MSYRREICKLNKDNFKTWKELMRLHLSTIGDSSLKYLDTKYVAPTRTMTTEEITERNNHNIMIIDIASTLNYTKFDEVSDCGTSYEIWILMKAIYGGDDNVRRAKVESLRY